MGMCVGTRVHQRWELSAGNMYVFVNGDTTSMRVDSVEKCASIKFIGLPPCDRSEQIEIIRGKKVFTFFHACVTLTMHGPWTGTPFNDISLMAQKIHDLFSSNDFPMCRWMRVSKTNILITAIQREKKINFVWQKPCICIDVIMRNVPFSLALLRWREKKAEREQKTLFFPMLFCQYIRSFRTYVVLDDAWNDELSISS